MADPLRFELLLTVGDGLPLPNARLWLDLSDDWALDEDEEVRMTSADRSQWIGIHTPDAAVNVDGLFFLLRFVAPPGTTWSFRATRGDDVLYTTQPGLKTGKKKETLTGFLRVPGSSTPRPAAGESRHRDDGAGR